MQHGGLATRFLVGALATWRVTHPLVEGDGPADGVVRLRRRAGDGWIGQARDCFYCLSIWTAAPVAAPLAPPPRPEQGGAQGGQRPPPVSQRSTAVRR